MNCPPVNPDICAHKLKSKCPEHSVSWSLPHSKDDPIYIEAWGTKVQKEPSRFPSGPALRQPEPREERDEEKRGPPSPTNSKKPVREPSCQTVSYRLPFDPSPCSKPEDHMPLRKDPGILGRDLPAYSPKQYPCERPPPVFYWKGHEPFVSSPCLEPPKTPLDCQKTSDFYRIDENLPLRFQYPGLIQNYGRRAEHLRWQTENAEYGRFPPTIHVVPVKYCKRNWNYWDDIAASGMPRDRSLNICLRPCVSKSFECKTLCL